ncbi:uncharacterized protein LOC107480179 [Arachis duranensis]|uniref:Uncharacterized protein LOC107480179 n=1 Tax=Arachis duranensis TaxID=130453 RepID=A0A6P4CSX1_ARADU|nr:uncharacterized protein LOC107480179 [Arachis duranensis]
MSGVSSLAVSGAEDTRVPTTPPRERRRLLFQHEHDDVASPPLGSMNLMGSLRVIELQLVAFILVFSASGLVSLMDLAFPAFVTIYAFALSRFSFPSYGSPPQQIFHASRLFQAYVVVGTAVGMFLPLAYVLGGFGRGDQHAVRSASPHLFLLSFQILSENIMSGLSMFSAPVRALVLLMYTIRRISVDIDWLKSEWLNTTLPPNLQFKDVAWFWFGRILALTNLVYYSLNLFGFLIPRFLPRAFERYFQFRGEIHTKADQDYVVDKSHSPEKQNKSQ